MVLTTFSLIAAFMLSMLSILSLAELPELVTCETSDQIEMPIIKLKAALPIQRNRLYQKGRSDHFRLKPLVPKLIMIDRLKDIYPKN